jgi:hypothetical protein
MSQLTVIRRTLIVVIVGKMGLGVTKALDEAVR